MFSGPAGTSHLAPNRCPSRAGSHSGRRSVITYRTDSPRGNACQRPARDLLIHRSLRDYPRPACDQSGGRSARTDTVPARQEPGPAQHKGRLIAQQSTRFINDYNCHLRARIGELLPEAADTWWRLSAPADQLAAIVSSAITGYAQPWLARFSTWDDTLRQLEAAPADPNWFMSPPRLTAMRMRLARGEHAAAERDFAEHIDARVKHPRNPGHLEFLAEIAAQHSCKAEVAAATAGAPRQ